MLGTKTCRAGPTRYENSSEPGRFGSKIPLVWLGIFLRPGRLDFKIFSDRAVSLYKSKGRNSYISKILGDPAFARVRVWLIFNFRRVLRTAHAGTTVRRFWSSSKRKSARLTILVQLTKPPFWRCRVSWANDRRRPIKFKPAGPTFLNTNKVNKWVNFLKVIVFTQYSPSGLMLTGLMLTNTSHQALFW